MYKECLNSINIRRRIKKEDKIRHLATCAGTITLVPHRYNLINDTEKQEKIFNHGRDSLAHEMGRTWVHRGVVRKGQCMEVKVVQGTQEKKEKTEPGFHRRVKWDSNY
jgi:hypothetical protein